ncbi:MAG: acyl-CoA synthetase [Xanthomonadaceae bacterium]|nr:acyl-CoA synthetase [Xanthomonadaceae bacterium]
MSTAPVHALALAAGPAERAIAFGGGGAPTNLARFLAEVAGLAETLPDAPSAILLCEDRYRFLVAFCAVAVRGQINLLPPSRTPQAIEDVRAQHPESYCIADDTPSPMPPRLHVLPAVLPQRDAASLRVDANALAMIGFTSGSTGAPKPNPKTWGSLHRSTAQNLAALRHLWPSGRDARIVATVPPQHMYGMELSILLPLLGDAAVHRGRPFFPDDVARALAESDAPCLLVTTPVHLRALVESSVAMPPLAGVVTATAPLSDALAEAAEARFGCEVRELFGSTETCVIAQRRTAHEQIWHAFPGVRLSPQPDGTVVHAAHLPAPVTLADIVELRGDDRFALCGRQADLLEIAGKRASLGDLTRRLLAVPGVTDGVVFQLDPCALTGVRRIAALAVAPELDERRILDALRHSVDAVFLPRKLRIVDALPRNETGKLPRAALLRLLT